MASLKDWLKELDKLKKDAVITDDEYESRRAAILNDTSSPSGGRRGGIFKWGLLGCLGIFALVGALFIGVIVIIVVAVGSSGSSLATNKDVRVAYAEGSNGTVTTAGDVKNRVTIRKIIDPAQSTNQFEKPAPGKHYLTVAVSLENVGTRETTGGQFTLRANDGTEYKSTFVSGVGASDLNSFQSLTSGGRTDAVLAFEVGDGKTVQWLKFDPNPFANGDLYFDAK